MSDASIRVRLVEYALREFARMCVWWWVVAALKCLSVELE